MRTIFFYFFINMRLKKKQGKPTRIHSFGAILTQQHKKIRIFNPGKSDIVDSVRCSLSRQHYACPFSLII
jgi:hypothetical protein